MSTRAFFTFCTVVMTLCACKGSPSAGKGSPSPTPSEQPAPAPSAPTPPAGPVASEPGLPVRQFHLQDILVPGQPIDTKEPFSLEGDIDGNVFAIGADAVRARFFVKEKDSAMNVITPRPGVYVEVNVLRTSSMRALCATEVTVIDRGAAPIGHAYSYDMTKGSRLACWVNAAGGPREAWQEIELATSISVPDKDMFWAFAMSGSRTEPQFDVIYAQDAEWTPHYYHSIGRKDREKGFQRTVALAGGKPTLSTLADGEFPDFSGLQRPRPGTSQCQFQCGWVFDSAGWNDCGACANGGVCVGGSCQAAGKACTPKTKAQACDPLACGKYSDGCGGRIDCGESCPDQMVCGADGTYRRCGKRVSAKTADEVRSSYGDVGRQLCGVFSDPATSSQVDVGACPDADQTCKNNLCNPLRAAPTPPPDAGAEP